MSNKIPSEKRIKEVLGYYAIAGKRDTLKTYNIKDDTLRRYIDWAKKTYGLEIGEKSRALNEISKQYSNKELQAIARGSRITPGQVRVPIISFEGQRIRIGGMTDSHYGSIYTSPDMTFQAFEEFKKSKVDFIVHAGDIVEGMSNRAGHIYELSHLGYSAQKKESVRILKEAPAPLYLIDGNHDRWFVKSSGAYIVEAIAKELGATYLGQDEGDISLKGKASLKLWHGIDGNSYALSYRIQKIIESFSGGEKPGVLMAGHVHKALYIFERNVHAYGLGTLQQQSKWMRGKRLAAHVGFWIIDIWVGDKGVTKSMGTFYPFYA